jgi:hypothetical protein
LNQAKSRLFRIAGRLYIEHTLLTADLMVAFDDVKGVDWASAEVGREWNTALLHFPFLPGGALLRPQ